jgi:hypothetical protein
VPTDSTPKFTVWRRQLYRCSQCGRASSERHPGFHTEFLITNRFADWVKSRSSEQSIAQLAKTAGMNRVLLQRIFGALAEDASRQSAEPLSYLGIAVVDLAGSLRPMIADAKGRRIIDVLPANSALQPFFQELILSGSGASVTHIVRDVIFDFPDLLSEENLRRWFPSLQQASISSRSMARQAEQIMMTLCRPLFIACAAEENRSPKSVRHLFARRRATLKRSASSRLRNWDDPKRPNARLLYKAYELKEEFIRIWIDDRALVDWQDWIAKAGAVPQLGFSNVVNFVKSRRAAVDPCFGEVMLLGYELWLNEVQKYKTEGTQGFAAARLALLTKFGQSRQPTKS